MINKPLSPWIIVDVGACHHPICYLAGRWESEAGALHELRELTRYTTQEWRQRLRVEYSPELLAKNVARTSTIASQNRAKSQLRSAAAKASWRARIALRSQRE